VRVEVFSKIRAIFLPFEPLLLGAGILCLFEVGGKLEEEVQFFPGEIQFLEEVTIAKVKGHI